MGVCIGGEVHSVNATMTCVEGGGGGDRVATGPGKTGVAESIHHGRWEKAQRNGRSFGLINR